MQENSIATDSTVTSTNKLIHCKWCTIEMHSQVLFDLVVYGKTAQISQRTAVSLKHMNKTFKYI